jgi:uncharacterized protein YjbI with pentapeptide repeats
MANEEHLAVLNRGVEAWNEWRKTNHEKNPNLNGIDLSWIDLCEAILMETILPGVDLSWIDLSEADLPGVDLSEANLRGVDLSGVDLRGADLSRADLREANLSGADLREANLSGADLREANLRGADLSKANLSRTHIRGADLSEVDLSEVDLGRTYIRGQYIRTADLSEANLSGLNLSGLNLSGADLSRADLSRADLSRADLSEANLSGADLSGINLSGANLSGVNLSGANLSGVNLSGANLSGKDLRGVNLSETNLSRIQALETNFERAIFTGACIEYWHTNSKTNLNNVICDSVYLKQDKQERRPSDPEINYAPGEFTILFQKALETVDLIFSDGIEWRAFLASFEKLQVECGSDELAIQAIEKKFGSAFIIRIEVPSDADKAKVEKYLKREYEIQLKAIEDRYRLELNAKDKEIEIYKQQSTNMFEIAKLAASRPINISQTQGDNMAGDRNIHIGSGNYNELIEGNYVQGNYYASEHKQTLSEAAAEIEKLLKQLEKSNPTATAEQQQAFVDAAVDPTLKAKFLSALQAGWKEAIKEFLDNPYVNVGVAILEGWEEAE